MMDQTTPTPPDGTVAVAIAAPMTAMAGPPAVAIAVPMTAWPDRPRWRSRRR